VRGAETHKASLFVDYGPRVDGSSTGGRAVLAGYAGDGQNVLFVRKTKPPKKHQKMETLPQLSRRSNPRRQE